MESESCMLKVLPLPSVLQGQILKKSPQICISWRVYQIRLSPIIMELDLSYELRIALIFIVIGIISGLIAGSSIWGAVSAIGALPSLFFILYLTGNRDYVTEMFMQILRNIEFERIVYLYIGGLIGGLISSRFSDEDDYIILRLQT